MLHPATPDLKARTDQLSEDIRQIRLRTVVSENLVIAHMALNRAQYWLDKELLDQAQQQQPQTTEAGV